MNCQHNDLAYVAKVPPPCCAFHEAVHKSALGKIVRCSMLVIGAAGPLWVFEHPLTVTDHLGHEMSMMGLSDEFLRPIRNPGNDEKDEIRPPLPVEGVHP